MNTWRPTPFLLITTVLQALALLALFWHPGWVWAVLGFVFLNQLAITAVSLWPRSTWLGPNLVRLPPAAAQRGEVAITIDDGPDPQVTPQVLDILAAHGARASFFCVGERAAAQPELCRRIRAGGHRLENHGLRHRWHESFLGYGGWLREIGAAQQRITEAAGEAPRYFRAMAGLRNPFLEPALRRLGLQLASWTRRGFDTRTGDPELVLQRLLRGLAAGDILLLHDGHSARTPGGRPVILEVLPRLLQALAARGLRPVTLEAACRPS